MSHKVIHIAKLIRGLKTIYLFLKKTDSETYQWFEGEIPTEVKGITPEEANRLARRYWSFDTLQFLDCGKRFTLPERDEHGGNTLFHQMVASYRSFNGIYFDEELGHSCQVREASQEALDMMALLG